MHKENSEKEKRGDRTLRNLMIFLIEGRNDDDL